MYDSETSIMWITGPARVIEQPFLCKEHVRKQSMGSANVTRGLYFLIIQQAVYAVCTLHSSQKDAAVLMLYVFSALGFL